MNQYEQKFYNHLNHLGAPFHHVPSPGLASLPLSPSASEAQQLGIEELHGSLAGATKTTDSRSRSSRMMMIIIIVIVITTTSSTAQGGGGSFKNRKPIGDVGCCESRMAERIH